MWRTGLPAEQPNKQQKHNAMVGGADRALTFGRLAAAAWRRTDVALAFRTVLYRELSA